jgi:hypothetical protein
MHLEGHGRNAGTYPRSRPHTAIADLFVCLYATIMLMIRPFIQKAQKW